MLIPQENVFSIVGNFEIVNCRFKRQILLRMVNSIDRRFSSNIYKYVSSLMKMQVLTLTYDDSKMNKNI